MPNVIPAKAGIQPSKRSSGFRIKSGMTLLLFSFLFLIRPVAVLGQTTVVCGNNYCNQLCAAETDPVSKTACLTGCQTTCAQGGKFNIGCALPPDVKISPLLPQCTYWEGTPQSRECGCRNINELVKFLIIFGNYLIGGVGAFALLFFMYGGFLILTAAGVAEKVQKGKQAIVAAVIGIVIVFSAQLLVRFIIQDALRAQLKEPGKSLEVKPEPNKEP